MARQLSITAAQQRHMLDEAHQQLFVIGTAGAFLPHLAEAAPRPNWVPARLPHAQDYVLVAESGYRYRQASRACTRDAPEGSTCVCLAWRYARQSLGSATIRGDHHSESCVHDASAPFCRHPLARWHCYCRAGASYAIVVTAARAFRQDETCSGFSIYSVNQ